jgi:hypothetical protein
MKRPFAPQIPVVFSNSSRGITTNDMGKAYIQPSTGREHDEGSQYYGHDIVIKRYAGLPLVSQTASADHRARVAIRACHQLQFTVPLGKSMAMHGTRAC